MITAILILIFRWLWQCEPLTDAGSTALVFVCVIMTFVETALIWGIFGDEIKDWLREKKR